MQEEFEEPAAGLGDASAPSASMKERLDASHRRIQGLLDQSREQQLAYQALGERVSGLESERIRLDAIVVRAEELVRAMEAGILAMRRSFSMRLGYLITHSLGSFGDIIRFPKQLLALLRSKWRRFRSDVDADEGIVPVPIPHAWFPTDVQNELKKLYDDISWPDRTARSGINNSTVRLVRRFAVLPKLLMEVRVAAIMDEFTFSAYRDCCDVLQVTPDAWKQEIDGFQPHLLFIESAWDGKQGMWQRKISGASRELRDVVAYCRKKSIPVVFWSKEDPVHFKTFLPTARLADVVFTTDIDCVAHYRRELRHDRAFLLPFATQPRAHDPVERYERKHNFCFAGSYYVRYPVRQDDFANLIDAANTLGGVDIYDRNYGKEHPSFIFPEHYHPYIVGGLAFDQIDIAYKGYDFGININTVKHSQSMFARRVFDLLASNTIVMSNYSRGLRLLFGDLVIASDDANQLVKSIRPLATDENRRRKHRLAGLRKVLGEHTYQQRLSYVLAKTFGQDVQSDRPFVTMLARVDSDAGLHIVLASFRRQEWPQKELVLCYGDDYSPAHSPTRDGIRVLSRLQANNRTCAAIAQGGYVAAMHPADYYGPHYLTDLCLGLSYSRGAATGKVAHFRMGDDGPVLESDGMQYREHDAISYRRALVPASQLSEEPVAVWLKRLDDPTHVGMGVALDEFHYVAGGAPADGYVAVDDLPDLDIGIPVKVLLDHAEHVDAGVATDGSGSRDESLGLAGIEGGAICAALNAVGSDYLSAHSLDGNLVFRSLLPKGRHVYVYMADDQKPAQLRFNEIGRFQLLCDRPDAIDLVFVYKDEQGEKISHSILRSGTNVTVTLPAGTHSVQVGFRIHGSGDIAVRRLVFEHVPLSVGTIVTRGRHLLLAKNYPSYQDLYKHAFVHRRVVEYRRNGLDVDVFRIGSAGLTYYEFDGVDVVYGQADHLRSMLESGQYDSVLVHFLDERMWEVLRDFVDKVKIFVWAHGAEIQSASRREFDQTDDETRRRAVALGDRRMRFWARIFAEAHPNLRMVFVSDWFASDVFADVGVDLSPDRYEVIHNFIDTTLFAYVEKDIAQRTRILSIRPFESAKYANDLSVAAVLALKERPFFEEFEFLFIGDGHLFDATMAPLMGLANVRIERGFRTQAEIAELHRDYGVFLNPTRMDAQGVSRDEAMSSGLVPITNRVTAIPEFVDDACGFLAEPEGASGLADAIEALYRDPALFQRMSRAAAERVRGQSAYGQTIAREIDMIRASSETDWETVARAPALRGADPRLSDDLPARRPAGDP